MQENPLPDRNFRAADFRARDGEKLFYRYWEARNPGALLFLIVHGFGEHSFRYDDFLAFLGNLPLSFATFDLRGHGLSGGERVFVERFEDYLSDLDDFVSHLKNHHAAGRGPIFLFGHSMGGQISVYYTITRPEAVKVLLLSSPCIAAQFWIPGAEKLALFLSRHFPHAVLANPVLPIFLTHDKDEIKRHSTDPLIQRKITFRLAGEMVRATELILGRAREIQIPLYLLTSGEERIVRKPVSRKFFERVSSREKRWIEFEGFYHEILKENGKEKVYEAVKSILEKHLAAKPA